MSGVKSVSRHEEALEDDGSFARQGGLIARQNLATHVSRNACHASTTILPSGWFYQNQRLSLKNPAYGRHRISQPMRRETPIPINYALCIKNIYMDIATNRPKRQRADSVKKNTWSCIKNSPNCAS